MKPPDSEWLGCFRAFRNKYLAALVTTAILFTNSVSGQGLQPVNGFGFQWKGGEFDSLLNTPSRGSADTSMSVIYKRLLKPGARIFDSVNHADWIWYNNKFNLSSAGAAQIPSDWNETNSSSADFIRNKPSFSLLAYSGDWGDVQGKPITLAGYGITDGVPIVRTITINGIAHDLSTNASWSIGAGGFTLTTTGTSGPATYISGVLNIPQYSGGGGGFTNPMTAIGDIIIGGTAGAATRLGIGSPGQVPTVSGGTIIWSTPSSGFSDPMTTAYDLIYRNGSNATVRLAKGANSSVLSMDGSGALGYNFLTNSNFSGSAAIANGNLAPMAAGTIKGNVTGSSATPSDITLASLAAAMPTSNLRLRNLGSPGDSLAYTINDSTFGFRRLNFTSAFAITRNSDSSLTIDLAGSGGGLADPMTTAYDIIYRDGTNTTVRLAKGADGNSLGVQGGILGYYSPSIWHRTTISTGTSSTITASNYMTVFDPASVIATYALTTPGSPVDNQMIGITAGGTITSGAVITALTISPNSGQTFIGTLPTTLQSGQTYLWYYRAATQYWYPVGNAGSAGFSDPMTTAYDIIIRNGSNVTVRKPKGADGTFWGVQGGVADYYTPASAGVATDVSQTYTSGSTLTVTNGVNVVQINPSSVVSALAITLPATAHNSNEVGFHFGSTITAGSPVITSISFVAPSGTTIDQATIPGEADSGEYISYKKIGTVWFRKN